MTPAPGPFGPDPAPQHDTLLPLAAASLTTPTRSRRQFSAPRQSPPHDPTPPRTRTWTTPRPNRRTTTSRRRRASTHRSRTPGPSSRRRAPLRRVKLRAQSRRRVVRPGAPNAHETPANVDAAPADTSDHDASDYLHPADHLPAPEPDEHDWQRVDRTPKAPVTDYSVFRYVRPAPAAEPSKTPSPDNAAAREVQPLDHAPRVEPALPQCRRQPHAPR